MLPYSEGRNQLAPEVAACKIHVRLFALMVRLLSSSVAAHTTILRRLSGTNHLQISKSCQLHHCLEEILLRME
jgi:hypothetical protein